MNLSRPARVTLRIAAGLGFAVIYVPLLLVLVNSLNPDRSSGWPPPGLTFDWWAAAWHSSGARDALWTSVRAGLGATAIALVLGTLIAFACQRYKFFGREAISFVVVLPIALPGIVTGVALNTAFRTVLEPLGVGLGMFTVIVGHATFCIVVVFNNVIARLRRMPGSYEEAAMDLGAHTFRTFVDITFPLVRSALVAGTTRLRPVLRRDRRDDLHRRARCPDPSCLDLLQHGPPPTGPCRQRRRRRPRPAVRHTDLPRPTAVVGHRLRQPHLTGRATMCTNRT